MIEFSSFGIDFNFAEIGSASLPVISRGIFSGLRHFLAYPQPSRGLPFSRSP
jgi:hypothetical protein